jgi:hypothetical protein
MTVDMHEGKFRKELQSGERFIPPTITYYARGIDFPAWRAIFSSMLLRGDSTGYRLPSVEGFVETCDSWYRSERHRGRFLKYREGDRRDEVLDRFRGFHEAGMAETYLYVCLVDVFEDHLRDGVVLYDSRGDWKLKLDAVVLRGG